MAKDEAIKTQKQQAEYELILRQNLEQKLQQNKREDVSVLKQVDQQLQQAETKVQLQQQITELRIVNEDLAQKNQLHQTHIGKLDQQMQEMLAREVELAK